MEKKILCPYCKERLDSNGHLSLKVRNLGKKGCYLINLPLEENGDLWVEEIEVLKDNIVFSCVLCNINLQSIPNAFPLLIDGNVRDFGFKVLEGGKLRIEKESFLYSIVNMDYVLN